MSIHHVRLLHGSAPNMSDRARLICFYELAAGDAWPLAGSSTAVAAMTQQQVWDWIGKNTYYGPPSATPRLADVPAHLPLPPAPDSSSIFKIQKSAGRSARSRASPGATMPPERVDGPGGCR